METNTNHRNIKAQNTLWGGKFQVFKRYNIHFQAYYIIEGKKTSPYRVQSTLTVGAGKKMPPSIIRRPCRFDSKIRGFWGRSEFVSACLERNKKIFRKIEISQNLPSFFAEKWANFARIEYSILRKLLIIETSLPVNDI